MKYLPRRTPKNKPKDLLKWVAAAFALVATATAEYELARAIGMHEWVAAAVPGALDAYVVRALRAHREVLTAVLAMVAVNAASHLVSAGVLQAEWPLITAVSAIAPLVLWRVHALGTAGDVRRRAVWGLPWRARKAEHTSTPVEHTDAVMCPMCGWGCPPDVLGKHIRETCPKRFEHTSTRVEHTGTDQERVRAQTDSWGDDWLDVHDAVNPPSTDRGKQPASPKGPAGPKGPVGTESATPPVPVHAPYVDHIDPSTRHLTIVHGERDDRDGVTGYEHAPVCLACQHTEHNGGGCEHGFCDCVHVLDPDEHWCGSGSTHTRHTYEGGTVCLGVLDGRYATEHTSTERTADDWNLEHVSTGVLEPDDVEHMERARELFHTIGGVPPFRALKEGTPGMGTERARRLRAALKAEHATSTPSTDGAHT